MSGRAVPRTRIHALLAALRRERAARRAAQAEARAKDELFATVSHELRTPLGAILIWTQLLRGERADEAAQERAIDMIERSSRSLAQIIDDLLDVSRIVAGKLRVERLVVDLGAVVAAAVESARLGAAARGVSLNFGGAPPDLPPVNGDAVRLQQIAANLISNAVKFTPRDGRVDVALVREGRYARLVVRDTGMGIEPEFLPYVFERFTQADGTTTRPHRGLGLGLAIARHLVERHGGTIEVASRGAGQGSTFTVNLPLHFGVRAVAPAGMPETPAELSGIRVFLVDDDPDAREAMSVLLRHCGASVRSFSSAPEAFQALVADPPDVLLSDIAMPGEDGYSLIRRIRALPPQRGGQVRAAAVTAYVGAEDRTRALSAGYDEHLSKPLNPDALVGAAARLGRALASSKPTAGPPL